MTTGGANREPLRRHLLFVHDEFTVLGGGERLLLRVAHIARPMARLSLAVLFTTGTRPIPGADTLFDRVVDLQAPSRFGLATIWRHWQTRRRLRSLAASLQPAACLAFTYPAAVRLVMARPRGAPPLVWVCQEDVSALLARGHARRRRAVFQTLRRSRVHVVCLSEAARDDLRALGFAGGQLHLIPNAPAFTPESFGNAVGERRASLRRRLGIAEGALVAICIAHLDPVKQHEVLVEAVDCARREGTAIALVCVGGELPPHAAHAQALRDLTMRLGLGEQVFWVGEQESVGDWLAMSDVAVLASAHEAAPTFLLEASAAGLPLVGSDVPGIRNLITPGANGLLFPAGDAAACARALGQLAADPARRTALGADARQRVLATAGRMEQQWAELLRALDV